MHELTSLILSDMRPALGVTEPGAIAYAAALAKSHTTGAVKEVLIELNSGLFKNAFTCGIPGSSEVGNAHAAALGVCGGDPKKELECLEGITAEAAKAAKELVASGKVKICLKGISSDIYLHAEVLTESGSASVTIEHAHTNVTEIRENGQLVYQKAPAEEVSGQETKADGEKAEEPTPLIHRYSLEELRTYALTVPLEELLPLREAYSMNLALFDAGRESERTSYLHYLLKENGGEVYSRDIRKTALLLGAGAIEARVLGLSKPAMSITGSGSHGIICTLPLYGAYRVMGLSEEQLLRATALSFLVCMYIKEYSGKLSAFCGCGIAGGTGMACGLALLKGLGTSAMAEAIDSLASSITGMICHGGNQGCTMKAVVAIDAAFQAVDMAAEGVYINEVHGINGKTPEDTMRHMGLIASPGMTGTEKTILDILKEKQEASA